MSGQTPHPEFLYFRIAQDCVAAAERESADFKKAQQVCSSFVFSALALEAFINRQYELIKLPAALYKLVMGAANFDVKTKWHLLPLLLGFPETFDKGKQPFQKFAEVVALRNAIVHFRASEYDPQSQKASERYFADVVKDVPLAKSYFLVVEQMVAELHRLTGGKTDAANFFNVPDYLSKVWIDTAIPVEILTSVQSQS